LLECIARRSKGQHIFFSLMKQIMNTLTEKVLGYVWSRTSEAYKKDQSMK